ncbi:MAG: cyanophycin synthetase [Actinomycetota bacterium]|nr:cyanophycin synthetase [Actinomycetota bacterium]
MSAAPVTVSEVRVLEGPNLYFARPAIKIIVGCPGYQSVDERTLSAISKRLGMRVVRPGPPDSDQRQRAVMRLVAAMVHRIAADSGTTRLGVRVRTGGSRAEVVVAFPWRWRGRGLALGESLGPALVALLDPDVGVHEGALSAAVAAVTAAERGAHHGMVKPKIPVASVTGTNGKTTTTRLLGHIGMTAGLVTAWSSTEGVVAQGEIVQEGDYSGPSGGSQVLATPGVQLGILETARGGLLLKGMGISVNDVSVVTNVSADHLGQHGIDTVDQLAEVKAIVTKVTKPTGWVILNGDDPRVWAMRFGIKARPWAFSLDPNSPALWQSLGMGGRCITVLDGDVVVLKPNADPDHLAPILDVPMTLSGLSDHNLANALAGTAAALALGLPREAVVQGLRTFAPDPRFNPGRMNVYTVPLPLQSQSSSLSPLSPLPSLPSLSSTGSGSVTVIIDFAHNEAGLEGLLRVAEGLRPPGSAVHLGLGTAGDRSDEILHNLGELAGRRADRVSIIHKAKYLRGREPADLEAQLHVGLARVGVAEVDSYPSELEGLQALVAMAGEGDVLAVMVHSERAKLEEWLKASGATADSARDIRKKVVASRGEHEAEAAISELWAMTDAAARVTAAQALLDSYPGDPRLIFELACVHDGARGDGHDAAQGEARHGTHAIESTDGTDGTEDSTEHRQQAIALYQKAVGAGLREPYRHRALLQQASGYRDAGDLAAARAILDPLSTERPGSAAVAAFRALVMLDQGEAPSAVADLIHVLLSRSGDADDEAYREALHRHAEELH